jgi:hypothetical protein
MLRDGKAHQEAAKKFHVEVKDIEVAVNQLMIEWVEKHKREHRSIHQRIMQKHIHEEISKPFSEKRGRKPWLEDNDV